MSLVRGSRVSLKKPCSGLPKGISGRVLFVEKNGSFLVAFQGRPSIDTFTKEQAEEYLSDKDSEENKEQTT